MKKRSKQKTMLPQKASRTIEKKYKKLIASLARDMKKDVREQLIPVLECDKNIYQDTYEESTSDAIKYIIAALVVKYSDIVKLMNYEVEKIVKKLDSVQKSKFLANINSAIGVDMKQVLARENLDETVKALIHKQTSLIKSIPDEFFKQIEHEIYTGITNGDRYETIAKRIKGTKDISSVFGKLDNRVKFIARNEVENINAILVKKRSEKIGIKKFKWQTARDERVRGNPAGKYPDSKCSHYKLDGEIFEWKKGAKCGSKTIWPGTDFNCRCVAINMIEGITDEE